MRATLSLLLFLNELSYRPAASIDLDSALGKLLVVLRSIRKIRHDATLIAEFDVDNLEFQGGLTLRQWGLRAQNRESARFIRGLRNRAPYTQSEYGALAEYHIDGVSSQMLGLAHLSDGFGVAMDVFPEWSVPEIALMKTELREREDGELVLEEEEVIVRHAVSADHVYFHNEWLIEVGLDTIHSGLGLWQVRAEIYPNLRFLPRVKEDLEGLRREWLVPVKELLAKLSLAVADVDANGMPQWRTKITPEGEQRKLLCRFYDPDVGEEILFDLHARMTPGAGRVHIRWDGSARKVVVAYIGTKIGA